MHTILLCYFIKKSLFFLAPFNHEICIKNRLYDMTKNLNFLSVEGASQSLFEKEQINLSKKKKKKTKKNRNKL